MLRWYNSRNRVCRLAIWSLKSSVVFSMRWAYVSLAFYTWLSYLLFAMFRSERFS